MAVIGLGVADAAHDRQVPVVPELLQPGHARVEAKSLTEGQYLLFGVGQVRAGPLVGRVGGRDDGAQAVVAAVEGQHHQHVRVGGQRVGVSPVDQLEPAQRRTSGDGGRHAGGRQEPASG